MERPIEIVIVGGGTAGWLAALVLQDATRRDGAPARITVVESSRIPTIGVGEGTTAAFRMMLLGLGLDEFEFLRETEATVKLGIRHRDWRGDGSHYDGPIDDPHRVLRPPAGAPDEYLNVYAVGARRPLQDMHLFGRVMARGGAPWARGPEGRPVALGPFHYAYHFDQAKVGRWLRVKAKGVETLDATVAGLERDGASGDVSALALDGGARISGDFFVDATGFRRALIGPMGARWISYSDALPVNRAMPFWLARGADEEIDNFTLARALSAGWLWKIPTQARDGCGYAYNDAFLSPDGARQEVEAALGRPIEPRNDIKIDAGRVDRAWIGNCLALGLASSFLEPLEATSIHGTVVQLSLFAARALAKGGGVATGFRDEYCRRVGRQVDDFRTFVNAHYMGGRADAPFWRDVAASRVHAETRARLDAWRRATPKPADFEDCTLGLPHVGAELHYPVLDGLGLLDPAVAKAELAAVPAARAFARKSYEALSREYRAAARLAMGHAEFLAHARGAA
ncbi:MAG: tryptophan 7-halogenase [Hyphomicrobiales bacterium]|nr:tryptophan 7-halogenase [Hyphomicrobiales bacterium]